MLSSSWPLEVGVIPIIWNIGSDRVAPIISLFGDQIKKDLIRFFLFSWNYSMLNFSAL